MSLKKSGNVWVVKGKGIEFVFKTYTSAVACCDAYNDMKKAGLL